MILNFIYSVILFIILMSLCFIIKYKRYEINDIKYHNSSFPKYSISKRFIHFYETEVSNLHNQIEFTKKCLKIYKNNLNQAYRCNEYRTKLPHVSRIKYPEIYNKYNGGYSSVIEPTPFSGYDIIFAIPFAPIQIDGRIAARNTIFKEEYIDGLKTKYIFFTGLIPYTLFSYKYSDLIEEEKMFDDIIVFNMINTYFNITLLMMSMYKWIIEKHSHIKYFIRCNIDALVFPSRIKGLLNKGYDVITEMVLINNVIFPQGSFYIFSMKTVTTIYNRSFTHKPMHRADDYYYGQIIGNDSSIKKYNLRGEKIQMIWDCQFCEYIKSKSMIAMHPYSPASIMIMYNITNGH